MMIFFLSPNEEVYARYGGRCDQGPDDRQSLKGLRYTMESVLAEHSSEAKRFAPVQSGDPLYIRDIAPFRGTRRCLHCHEAKEAILDKLDREGKWNKDMAFRFPPPDNLGLVLDVDRGNVAKTIKPNSAAAAIGLQRGDLIRTLNGVPIHSFGDAQYALDRAPQEGAIEVTWERSGESMRATLELPDRWRRTDFSWRPSMWNLVAASRVYGENLTAEQKAELGIPAERLAFFQKEEVPRQARDAGVQPGDIVLGVDDLELEMDAYEFQMFFRSNYVRGETVTLNIIRDGKRLRLPMLLR